MTHILERNGNYYFNRKVPVFLKTHDPRPFVRVALHTDSRKEALKLALDCNEGVEDYWRDLVRENRQYCDTSFKAAIQQFRLSRFAASEMQGNNAPAKPISPKKGSPTLREGLKQYWGFAKDKTINRTPNWVRKWKNPRKLAVENLIGQAGNKPMLEYTRSDLLLLRDWWIDRIEGEDNYAANTANKNFFNLKTIFETVSDNLGLGINVKFLFQKLKLEEDWENNRPPFETDYIRKTLLNPGSLAGMNEQARAALHVIAEAGVGLTEQVGLGPENIHLDCEIPYIEILPGKNKTLKTRYRKRTIPLVGFALDAFKAFPNGFDQYKDRPDQLSAVIGKYLRENKLLPSENHTTYSLRHSFQDRLLAANAPDRVQADLMGHKFNRPAYGDGATLAHKWEWLQKIKIKN